MQKTVTTSKMNSISEKTIEDILTADKSILAEILGTSSADLSLISRQKTVPSGKLDLLYLSNDELLLIELKVVGFYDEVINQINGYHFDLQELQKQNKLIHSDIQKIVLVPKAKPIYSQIYERENIRIITFNPEDVLSKFYEHFKELSHFLTIQAGDYGVVRLGLLNTTLKLLGDGLCLEDISKKQNKSAKTIKNRISVASLLNLVVKFKNEYFLTDLGTQFNEMSENTNDRLSQAQMELLGEFLVPNSDFDKRISNININEQSIHVLAKEYKVSREVVFRKLLDRKLIDREYYSQKVEQWSDESKNKHSKKRGGDYYATKSVYLGKSYIELAFKRYHQKKISIDQLAGYLDIKVKYIPGMEPALSRKGNAV